MRYKMIYQLKSTIGGKILLTFLTILFLNINSNSQVTQEWATRYNGPGNEIDDAYSVVVDSFGNVYITGSSLGIGTDYDYATIKYNSSGIQEWVSRYNGLGNGLDQPHAIALDNSGNVYVTGRSYGGVHWDYATVKYNTNGVQQWVQIYNGPGNDDDEAFSLVVDNLANVYITGCGYGIGWNGTDCVTIKYNTSGILQWIATFSSTGGGQTQGNAINVDASGNVYVGGFCTYWNPLVDRRYLTIKYNSTGVQQWVQNYHFNNNGWDQVQAIALDGSGNGNVFVTGYSIGVSSGYDYATIKYNYAGDQQWLQRYNGPGNDYDNATSIAIDGNGNVFVTGYSIGVSSGYDYATIKYNSAGEQQWLQRYDGPGDSTDIAYSMVLDLWGNVYVTGYSRASASSGWGDYATIKYNSAGVQKWVQRYNGTGDSLDRAYSINVDGSGNIYVTGTSCGIGTSRDYLTIKYFQLIGIQPITNLIPIQFSLSQNYPNPFNPGTNIEFAISNSSLVKLVVYDLLGKEVETLVSENLKAGTYKAVWNADKYPSGVYFYRLETSNFTGSKKMLLLK